MDHGVRPWELHGLCVNDLWSLNSTIDTDSKESKDSFEDSSSQGRYTDDDFAF